ncbi:glycosyltransferase [Luteimonas yanweni]
MPVTIAVSIIIPVFQDSSGIHRCLRSLSRQTYPMGSLEVIVVDNGSVPAISVSDDYPFKIVLVRCLIAGSYAARNAGVLASSGEVLAFTDADCTAEPAWVLNGVASLKKRGGDVIIGGEVRLIAPAKQTATALYQTIVGFQQRENIERKLFSVTANLLCMRSVFDAAGPFAEGLLSGGDREWCWRAGAKGFRVIYAPDVIVDTPPRSTLRGAIRQARRVAAGRLLMTSPRSASIPRGQIEPHRSAFASIRWLLQHPALRASERLQVLAVACLIRASVAVEYLRLRLGGSPERR